jgi:DNA gyrase subunit A
MVESTQEILSVNLEDEMQASYLDYAMSVIVGRALPDIRDGLKPVHRRVLYAMNVLGNDWNKAYKKSARVVGDVIGKYHPHGDSAVYDTIVRMAQPFSMRYMLVDGQGNFGSIDGDSAAAMRYTEIRMSRIAHEMLADIDKETVDFQANYDESEHEPVVMPSRIPALLINGSSGIAVGMATNIPPHNLGEILRATIALIDKPDLSIDELMAYVPGPDFPTAGIINGAAGIREAYHTGRGRIYVRSRVEIEEDESTGKPRICVTELPYQVNKARLMEKIAELVKDKRIEGITELRDESDKDGMRMVIELRRGEVAEVVLNNLYQQTQMQNVFGINMVALDGGRPKVVNLKHCLEAFIRHRREVVTRRTIFELRKARARAHILEGLAVALANIDEVIELIKRSPTPADAREGLLSRRWQAANVADMLEKAGAALSRPETLDASFGLSDEGYLLSNEQAQAILDLRLHRLTGLEQDRLLKEYGEIIDLIKELVHILEDPDRLLEVIREELAAIIDQYGDERRSEILDKKLDLSLEDLITEQNVVVTLSHAGYAKCQPIDDYQAQRRGGRGRSATAMKDEDFIDKIFVANTHDTLLCFTSAGKVYWIKVFELPQASRASRGKPIVNLLPLEEGERVQAVQAVREFDEDRFVFFSTRYGTVKKTPLVDFSRPRSNGIIAIDIVDGDSLNDVAITDGQRDILLFGSHGKVTRFNESDVRSMGRVSRGVRGIRMPDGAEVVSMVIADEGDILTATENGYGKRTSLDDYPTYKRGGQGVIAIAASDRNGALVGALQVLESDEVMLISNAGTLVRTRAEEISRLSRNTQGVTLIRLGKKEKLVALDRIAEDDSLGDDDELVDGEASDVEVPESEGDEG